MFRFILMIGILSIPAFTIAEGPKDAPKETPQAAASGGDANATGERGRATRPRTAEGERENERARQTFGQTSETLQGQGPGFFSPPCPENGIFE